MLIPKFSIRHLLLGLLAAGILSACVAGAMRGSEIAKGFSVAIFGLIIPVTFYMLVYWIGWLLSLVRTPRIDRLFLGDAMAQSVGQVDSGPEAIVDGTLTGGENFGSSNHSDVDDSDGDDLNLGGRDG